MVLKLLFKVILFPVMILLWALRFLIKAFNKISNVIIGIMMWFVLGCIVYATLYPIIKGQVDIGTCSYFTVAKLARFLGYRPDEIVYEKEDFQTFRNNLHHRIKSNELECILEIIESDDVSTYMRHEDYLKALYLVATVDYVSKKNDIPLCDKYSSIRDIRLEKPYYVGDSALVGSDNNKCIDEFLRFNIYEGDLYDAV